MAKTQKPKGNSGNRNDARANGKASKQRPGSRGSSKTQLSELEKILLGKGLHVKWRKVIDGKAKGLPQSAR